jgi:hypothetical protein
MNILRADSAHRRFLIPTVAKVQPDRSSRYRKARTNGADGEDNNRIAAGGLILAQHYPKDAEDQGNLAAAKAKQKQHDDRRTLKLPVKPTRLPVRIVEAIIVPLHCSHLK